MNDASMGAYRAAQELPDNDPVCSLCGEEHCSSLCPDLAERCREFSEQQESTLPCGHPAACDTGDGCGWCAVLKALRAMLEVHGDEQCYHDHHGLCQTHNLRRNEAGEPECQVALARAVFRQQESNP